MGTNSTIKILVFHYKNGNSFPDLPCYLHVWAGKHGKPGATQLTGDDSGINISDKNRYYSELTGIYWFWKNMQSEIIGTTHYRRFFTNQPLPFLYHLKQLLYYPLGLKRKRSGLIYCSNSKFWEKRILNCDEIGNLFKLYDAVLPQPRILKYMVEKHFSRYHQINDLQLLHKIIDQKYPEYTSAFQTMLKQNRLYANNMFILRQAKFDELAQWLFDILNDFEQNVDLKNYTEYQERIFGFLSERLITTWFFHHKELKIKELPLIYLKHFKNK